MHTSPGAEIRIGTKSDSWTLKIPAGPAGSYRLAQLDDYSAHSRRRFPWDPPVTLRLRARVSAAQIPGTWGFGLWNDPFSLSLGLGGGTRRFPALPNAAWFFFASSQNYLSFREDLPANGFIAQTFRSASPFAPLLALGALAFPLLLWPRLARKIRPLFRHWIAEESFALSHDPSQWHSYTLEWQRDRVNFKVDDQIFESRVNPKTPLGLVIWIDNQFAAFPPDGKIAYGMLENPQPAWLELAEVSIKPI